MKLKLIWFDLGRSKRIEAKLDLVLFSLANLIRKEDEVMADLTALTAQVQENTDVEASAIQLLNNLAALIQQNATDPVALQALADQLNGSADALAAAIVANTPPPTP